MVGFADCTLNAIADGIAELGFDGGADGWLVLAENRLPVGYAIACSKGDRQVAEIELTSQDQAVAAWLYEQTMQRVQEMGRERGHTEITVDAFVYRADQPLRTLLAGHGFTAATTYHRMRIDHTEPVPTTEMPAGVVVRRGTYDDATRWTAHQLIGECLHDQFGFVARPYDDWVQYFEVSSISDWSQLTLLEIDARAVAVRVCTDAFIETENCGHIGMLGVLEEFRGRGLAKFLLRDAFAIDAAAGRAGTILLVDTNNPTPALGLYLSAGMNPTLVYDGWRRTFAVI